MDLALVHLDSACFLSKRRTGPIPIPVPAPLTTAIVYPQLPSNSGARKADRGSHRSPSGGCNAGYAAATGGQSHKSIISWPSIRRVV